MIIDGVILLVDPHIRKLWFWPSYYCYANISNMISDYALIILRNSNTFI